MCHCRCEPPRLGKLYKINGLLLHIITIKLFLKLCLHWDFLPLGIFCYGKTAAHHPPTLLVTSRHWWCFFVALVSLFTTRRIVTKCFYLYTNVLYGGWMPNTESKFQMSFNVWQMINALLLKIAVFQLSFQLIWQNTPIVMRYLAFNILSKAIGCMQRKTQRKFVANKR